MSSDVIVEYLHTSQNWGVGTLERPHNLLSISYLTVHALHLVIVMMTAQSDLSNVNGAIHLLVGSVFAHVCVVIRTEAVSD